MKYMNHVKSGLLAMAFACAGIWRVWLCKVCRRCT